MADCSTGSCGAKGAAQKTEDQDAALNASLARIKNKFMVMSGKGGVGKSSTSVHLAMALAAKGYQVGIMDVDLHGPDIPRMLGLTGMLEMTENRKLKPLDFSKNLKAVSIEALTPSKDDAVIWRGPIKFSAIRQFISEVEWGDLDFLLIDSPPGTGDEPLTVAQTIKDAKAVIVTTPQEVSLADVRKSINFCKTVKMSVFGLIENMSGFVCPHCNKEIDLFGTGGGEKTALQMGVPFLGRIPFDPQVVACGDAGVAYRERNADSPVTRAFDAIAEKMGKLV
ncbi:MAG: Mrp/NBP35 family ATP-binding protein [Desulfobacterales bacterium]|jgi:Mrp family chromosome partitioning ATPase